MVSQRAIEHRIQRGRLRRVHRGVYVVVPLGPSRLAELLAAVLACGQGAVLSHRSAAELWGIEWRSQLHLATASRAHRPGPVDVSIPRRRSVRLGGIRCHRRSRLEGRDITRKEGVPVTRPVPTLIDLATCLSPPELEAAVNAADRANVVRTAELERVLQERAGEPGVPALRELLSRESFLPTDSELEREFLRLVSRAGLPPPETGARVNGFKVDFHWRELGLVVETDGLRYHRTPLQQARDRRRDQVHTAAGLTTLRFTFAQVFDEPKLVTETLARVISRLARGDRTG